MTSDQQAERRMLSAFPDRPLMEADLAALREHPKVRLAMGAEWRWHVEWDRDYATAIVVVTESRVAGLKYRQKEGGWVVAWSDDAGPDEDPFLLFMAAQEQMGFTEFDQGYEAADADPETEVDILLDAGVPREEIPDDREARRDLIYEKVFQPGDQDRRR